MKRACEMKKEFAMFYMSLEQEQRDDIEENMKLMLKKVVTNIDFVEEVWNCRAPYIYRRIKRLGNVGKEEQ